MKIVNMTKDHEEEVLQMMRIFYASPAVFTNGSDEIFKDDIKNCINDNPYLEGYVFVEDETICGYGMAAKSFSTEFGRTCIWIEDIYLKPEYRSRGIAGEFFEMLEQRYPDAVFRLEVEEENEQAVHVYRKRGFTVLPYMEMKKDAGIKPV